MQHQYTSKDIEKFWSRADKSGGENSCWNFGKSQHHPQFRLFGKRPQASHIAWEITFGTIPNDLWVLHKCDNPSCVNPKHLFLGTHRDNDIDRHQKGRTAKGERLPQHTLSDKEIEEIRKMYLGGQYTQYELAEIFRVNQSHISAIVNNKKRI